MSRIAKSPISLPKGVEVAINGNEVSVKGAKGSLVKTLNPLVKIAMENGEINFSADDAVIGGWAQAGTARSLVNAMVQGVSEGFEKKLILVGVGYRAAVQGSEVNLTLGFSHPVIYKLPEGISAEAPSQTELIIRGSDKQVVGQVAAEIRAYRSPEPYKGKGIKYSDEYILRKEAKKK